MTSPVARVTLPLALQASPSGRHVVNAHTGRPFFWKADTAWSLCHRPTDEEVLLYLDKRQEQGFNVVLTVVVSEHEGPNAPNQHGEYIFEADATGSRRDVTRPNEKYFRHIDWVVEQAAARGITVALVPTWGKWINGGWTGGGAENVIFNVDNAAVFGKYIGKRYPGLPKLLGGDTNPIWFNTKEVWKQYRAGKTADISVLEKTDTSDVTRAMARGITETEKAHGVEPFLTFHPTAMWLADFPEARAAAFFDEDWLSLDAVQSGHADFRTVNTEPGLKWWKTTEPYVAVGVMWDHATLAGPSAEKTGRRPVIDLEGHYEGMRNGLVGSDPRIFGEHDIRNGTYHSVLSGACGYVYGANSIWQMYEPGRGLNPVCGLDEKSSWKEDLAHFADAFDRRTPDQSIVLDSKSGEGRITVMRDIYPGGKPSTFVYAYSGTGQSFVLDIQKVFGSQAIKASWYNPRSGESTLLDAVSGDQVAFVPPSSGAIEHDWLLVVRAA